MTVNYQPAPPPPRYVSDQDSIKEWAKTESKRRKALDVCLNTHWANHTIGCLERVENATRWGWLMYPHRAGDAGPPA